MALSFSPPAQVQPTTGRQLDDADLASLVRRIDAIPELGTATFHHDWSYDSRGRRVTDVTLAVDLSIEMPRWTSYGSRPQAEKDEWDRFVRALRYHENQHIALYRREFRRSYRRISRANARTITDIVRREVARVRRVNRAFDRTSGHGERQRSPHGTTVLQAP